MSFFLFFLQFSFSFGEENCNPPYPPYEPIKNADLIQVQIITRHGARVPLHLPKTFSNVWECRNTEIRSISSDISHYSKIHVSFGKSIYNGNCHQGQLIENGTYQLNELGRYMREIYVKKLKFLPNNYEKTVKFRTTQSHRTIHSQMNFARGLFPDSYDIPIEIADQNYDFWRNAATVCPSFSKMALLASKDYEQLDDDMTKDDFANEISRKLGVKWSSVNDVLTSALCEGYSIPENITMRDIDKAISLKTKQMQYVYKHDSVFRLAFAYSFGDIVNEMIKRINGESRTRFIHWSAHDGNILACLGYLGYSDGKWPSYGSYIVCELFRSRETKDYFVVFRFNGKIIKASRINDDDRVDFNLLRDYVGKNIPDLDGECGLNIKDFTKRDSAFSP